MQSLRTRLDQLPYAKLFSIPGTRRFCIAAAFARLPMSMMSLGIVLALNHLYNNWTIAGTMSAAFVLAAAVVTPVFARLFDRLGQAKVGPIALAAQVVSMFAFAAGAFFRVPLALLFVLVILNGLTQFSFGALVRTRWAWALRETGDNGTLLNAAYAFEAAVDELVFIFGPILAAFLATSVHPVSQLVVPAICAAIGGSVFFAQRNTMPIVEAVAVNANPLHDDQAIESAPTDMWRKHRNKTEHHKHVRSALAYAGVPALVCIFMIFNASFSSFDVSITALTDELGVPQVVGIQLALFAFGSLIGALIFGSLHLPGSHWSHMVVFLAVLTAWYAIFVPASANLVVLGICEILAGVFVAPTFATANLLVKELVPQTSLTEGLAWVSTGTAIGGSIGSTAAGMVLDAHGTLIGLCVPAIACAAACVLTVFTWWRRHVQKRKQDYNRK